MAIFIAIRLFLAIDYPLHGEKVFGITVQKHPTIGVALIFTLRFWYRFTPIGKNW